VKIAINWTHKGKNPKGLSVKAIGAWFGEYNGGFKNHDLTPEELALAIVEGHGYTTQHTDYRKAANFIAGQHIGLDFDVLPSRRTLQDIVDGDPFIAEYAGLLHTTASHTPEAPRARVLFFLDRPIHDAEKYTELARALLDRYNQADPTCKDACRLFFGAEDCEILLSGNTLTLADAAHNLIYPYRAKLEKAEAERQTVSNNRVVVRAGDVSGKLLESHSQSLLDNVYNAPDGQKYFTLRDISRTFGGYIASGYYSEGDVRNWLRAAIDARSIESQDHAYTTIDRGIEYGKGEPLHFELSKSGKPEATERPAMVPDPSWRKGLANDR
jgi:hypothetical protein